MREAGRNPSNADDLCRQTEEALKAAELRYRTLFEQSPDGVVILDPESATVMEFNDQACRQLGYSREEFAGMRVADIDVVETPDETRSRIRRVVSEGRNDFVTQHRTRQGEIRDVAVTAQTIQIMGHSVYHCIWRDITEQKRAEKKLRESEALLNQVGQIARIGGWRMDLITRTAVWTRGTYEIVEIEPGQPIPGPDEHVNYYIPEHRPLVAEAMRALIEENVPLDFEAQLRTAKGNIVWCRAIGRAVRRDGRCVEVYGTFQDITESRRAEARLNEQLAELRRWHEATLGRETRILDLKREVNELLAKAGQPPRYPSATQDGSVP